MESDFILQDLGDEQGLDIVDGTTGDAFVFGRTRAEVRDFFDDVDNAKTVWIEAPALGRTRSEQVTVEQLVREL